MLLDELNHRLPEAGIDTPERIAAFLAITAFRSEDFKSLEGGLMGLSTANREAFAREVDTSVSYVSTLAGAVESAIWYWTKNKLDALADTGDYRALGVAVNGIGSHFPYWDVAAMGKLLETTIRLTKSPV